MANKYDAAALDANADQLERLAATARANMLSRTTEKATRVGADGERLTRQAKATEFQRADAEALAKIHLAEAAQYDAKANAIDQRAAAAAARGDSEAVELREDAAKLREGAEVQRSRARIASADAERLAAEAADMRIREQAIDAELADLGARLPVTELAVDNLEWHAEKARAMADTVQEADELQQQAAAATARGDDAAADVLSQRAANLRDAADVLGFVRDHPPFPVDQTMLSDIGVDLEPGALATPMPELIDPTSPMNPLAASSAATSDDVVADAGDAGDESPGYAMSEPVEIGLDSPAAEDFGFPDPSFDETSFDVDAFDSPDFDLA